LSSACAHMKLSLARSLAHSLALLRSPTVQRLNPIYGQGITVAAQSAITLARCLERAARADVQIRDFSRMYVRDLYRSLENSWSMATASDLRFPSTSLTENNVARPTAFERAVTDSLLDMAQTDPKLYLKLLETAHFVRTAKSLTFDLHVITSLLVNAVGRVWRAESSHNI
jgi:2-polyprenyl-6-methoxyphenol hydroxylase-like FAD-dependent oxidoreductase